MSECCCTYSGQKDSKSAKERLGGLAAATAGRCSAMATQTAVSAAQIWRGGRCVEAIALGGVHSEFSSQPCLLRRKYCPVLLFTARDGLCGKVKPPLPPTYHRG